MPKKPLKLPKKLAREGKTIKDITRLVSEKINSMPYILKKTKTDTFREQPYFKSLSMKIKRINQRLSEKTTDAFTRKMLNFELIRTKLDLNLLEFKVNIEVNIKSIEILSNNSPVVLTKTRKIKESIIKIIKDIEYSLEAQTISIENAKKFSNSLSLEAQRIDTLKDIVDFLDKKSSELQRYKFLN